MADKPDYVPTHCGGCSNDCPLSSPSCVIGMQKSDLYRIEENKNNVSK